MQYCLDYDDKDNAACFRPYVHNALTDTGTSMILMYKQDYDQVASAICDYVDNHLRNTYVSEPHCVTNSYGYKRIVGCSQEIKQALPGIAIKLDSYNYHLKPDSVYEHFGPSCHISLVASYKFETVLGTPFLNDYYQVYDMQRNQIGLVPSIYATA